MPTPFAMRNPLIPPAPAAPAPESSPRPPLVRLEEVSFGLGGVSVFSRLSLALYSGEHTALLGANGAGKSTLLRLIQGELRPVSPTDGRLFWGFAGVEETSPLAAREHVRSVSPAQQRNYVRRGWNITGEEVLLSGLDNGPMLYGEVSSAQYERAASLAGAAGASDLLPLSVPAMSQGQLRQMLILRALMSAPALLLLDEPFDGLDGPARERISACIALAASRGSTLVVSAHRAGDIPACVTSALLLENGQVRRLESGSVRCLENGSPALLPHQDHDPQRQKAARRDTFAPSPVPARSGPARSGPDHSGPARSGPDHSGPDHSGPADAALAPALPDRETPLLELAHVDVFIERRKVLSDISWTVLPGEQWLISGRNGSGKSTLLRLLYGEEFAAFGGSLLWRGAPRPGLEELRSRVGFVSDRLHDRYEYDLPADEVVISGLRGSVGLYHTPEPEERELARTWLRRLGLEGVAGRPFHSLSGGTARRVLLARALASSPPVLLLDEPCSGLDAAGRSLFFQALEELAASGISLFYVSHLQEEAGPLFTHELRLEQGRIAWAGPRKGLLPRPGEQAWAKQ